MDSHAVVIGNIKTLAEERQLSINRLADSAGVSRSHLAKVLRGVHSPTLATLDLIALALGVTTRSLFATSAATAEHR